MVGVLADKDRVFTNLYGLHSPGLEAARARGAWNGVPEIVACGRDWIIEQVKASGLRGRGGAGFSTGMKWSLMPKAVAPGRPHYLVVNADESEPGACKDREVLRHEPHILLESCMIASAAIQATANVQTVAAAAEQLSASIAEIGRQVADAASVSRTAAEETGRTNTMVQGLTQAADRIGEVVMLINDIAAQTNLLALNATIEAARAGEAGKGFAVVAGEVKGLATQTARATEEISAQIATVQEETRRAVEAIRKIGGVIDHVREISAGIAASIEEQGAATAEIARNVQQAAAGTQDVSTNISGVTQSVSSSGEAAGLVLASAGELARTSHLLRDRLSGFLADIRGRRAG